MCVVAEETISGSYNTLQWQGESRKPPTLAEHATQQLREAIISGALAPGETLLLNDLAKKLDISIMPVREALKRLQYEGLVEQPPQKEARVAPLSLADLDDTYAARILMETRAIRRSASRFSEEDYTRLLKVLEQYEFAYDHNEDAMGRALHKRFHFGMYQVGASPWLLGLISTLWDNSERYRRLSLEHRGSIHDRRNEHADVLEACHARDPEKAARLLESHLRKTAELVYQSAASALEQ
ncbi:MAG: GntR family transcriptional regulator [Sulfobacillus benefaciens]|uniref:GntR family transcriptional regulator n=1 Tax=Sulfobacillus benefaciens TaxID=453960 RepID=A0A2T2XJ27_9FIRM|nr:MAG: GntR family transcriptional regulator [Sulfobacillus benefaciens]